MKAVAMLEGGREGDRVGARVRTCIRTRIGAYRAAAFAALQFVATAGTMAGICLWLRQPAHLLYVWPLTGVQLAILLLGPADRRSRWLQISAASAGVLVARLPLQAPGPAWTQVMQETIRQALELWLLHRLLFGSVHRFDDLKRSGTVFRFLSVSLGAAVLAALSLAAALAALTPTNFGLAALRLALSDSLGVAVVTPSLLFVFSGRFCRFPRRILYLRAFGCTALFLAATVYLFHQTVNPFLFIIFPPLILVLFVLGTEGAVFCCAVATGVGCVATAYGHGPVWIVAGLSFAHRVLLLQIFLWCTAATALPVGSLLDERRFARRKARQNQAIYEALVSNSDHMILLTSFADYMRYVSPAVTRILGWTQAEYEGLGHMGGIHPEFRERAGEITREIRAGRADHTWRYRALCKGGGTVWVEATVRGFSDAPGGPLTGFAATIQDITKRMQMEEQMMAERRALEVKNERLRDLASTDELTGIANRRIFNQRLALEAMGHGDAGEALHLLLIDVDWFKKFNDLYGHQAGDACLKAVAGVFVESVGRGADLAARVGGEEFAVLLPVTNLAGAERVAEKILAGVRGLGVPHEGSPLGRVTVSVGIAGWGAYQTTKVAELMEQADRALYASKEAGRDRATVFGAGTATRVEA